MEPLWLTRAGVVFGVVMMVVSLAAFAWTEDTIHLTAAQGLGFGAAILALIYRMRKREIAANVPPPPEVSTARNALWAAVFLLLAVALAVLYDWHLYAFWTPAVVFALLFLVFMCVHYAIRLTRQLRSPRSPSHGP